MRHAWVKRFVANFEDNPDFQIAFHRRMMHFWEANAVIGTVLLITEPHLWAAIGVFYVFLLSIYANWDTDYDACSAALAFKHAKAVDEKGTDQ